MTGLARTASALAIVSLYCCVATAAEGYRVVKKVPIAGQGGWDYLTVDSETRRLYVSHGTLVEVMDLDTEKLVGQIPDTSGVHGIALVPEVGRGFTSNGKSNTSTMFDSKTLKILGEIPTGNKPDAILYDPASKRVFVFNGDGNSATAINPADGKVEGTVGLGGGPESGAADGSGKVFVNLEKENLVVVFDSKNLKVLDRWPLNPCKTPTAMAIDCKNHRLFIGCRSQVAAIVNSETGKVVQTLPIGDHVDAAAFDPEDELVFFSNGDGTVNVIHEDSPDKYTAVQTIQTAPRAKTMALDQVKKRLYLSTAEAGQFEVLVVGR
ncbi:MAG TPA: YncE family protein [Acidobacteriota bacterium]|nr:YncE family protein [Acidobacteriota bacterium]